MPQNKAQKMLFNMLACNTFQPSDFKLCETNDRSKAQKAECCILL